VVAVLTTLCMKFDGLGGLALRKFLKLFCCVSTGGSTCTYPLLFSKEMTMTALLEYFNLVLQSMGRLCLHHLWFNIQFLIMYTVGLY